MQSTDINQKCLANAGGHKQKIKKIRAAREFTFGGKAVEGTMHHSHETAMVLATLRGSANTADLTFMRLRSAAIFPPERGSALAVQEGIAIQNPTKKRTKNSPEEFWIAPSFSPDLRIAKLPGER